MFGAVIIVGEFEGCNQLDDTAGFCTHYFCGHNLGPVDVESMSLGGDAHDGENTGAKGGSQQIGGRKGFAPPLVVGWRVSDKFAAGLNVNRLGS